MHLMCFFWDSQISQIRSPSKSGTRPWSPWNVSSKSWISVIVSCTPQVFLRQWVGSSFLVTLQMTSSSLKSAVTPLFLSSQCLACLSSSKSSLLHSNMHWDSRPRDTAYSGWDSLVHPVAMHLMKCQISRDIISSDHVEKRSFILIALTTIMVDIQNFGWGFSCIWVSSH